MQLKSGMDYISNIDLFSLDNSLYVDLCSLDYTLNMNASIDTVSGSVNI